MQKVKKPKTETTKPAGDAIFSGNFITNSTSEKLKSPYAPRALFSSLVAPTLAPFGDHPKSKGSTTGAFRFLDRFVILTTPYIGVGAFAFGSIAAAITSRMLCE